MHVENVMRGNGRAKERYSKHLYLYTQRIRESAEIDASEQEKNDKNKIYEKCNTLQMPNGSASARIDLMYAIGSANCAADGRKTGASASASVPSRIECCNLTVLACF